MVMMMMVVVMMVVSCGGSDGDMVITLSFLFLECSSLIKVLPNQVNEEQP